VNTSSGLDSEEALNRTRLSGEGSLKRFPAPLEAEFSAFHLQQSRSGIRAWHTTAAVTELLVVALSTLVDATGLPVVLPWDVKPGNSLLITAIAVAALTRLLLAWLAWARFERGYGRFAFPLALASHACSAAVFSNEIFGPHPGYLTLMATYMFAACFLSGLTFRQAVCVNVAALAAMLLWRLHAGAVAGMTMAALFHMSVTLVISAIGAAAVERSSRRLFMEHSWITEMAARDGLTGLKNRRAFDEHLHRAWQQALRDRRCLAVLLIDVDHFKAYNDHFGHQAGDEALKRIAAVVESMARRPFDLAARYGGEELAIILFDLAKSGVADVAERVGKAVQELQLAHPQSPVAPCVTVSTGVAFVRPTLERTPQGALQLADRGLYAAKHAGRNRVVVLDRDLDEPATGRFESLRLSSGGS
jgi:diguanylate cyclase (GGDEF)-like protein